MPKYNTSFVSSWLLPEVKDNNGDFVADWCSAVKDDCESAFCKVCSKKFSIANMGFGQILSHSDGAKHKGNVRLRQGQISFKIIKAENSSTVSAQGVAQDQEGETIQQKSELMLSLCTQKVTKIWIPINLDDKVKKAEILLTLKLVDANYSFNSYSDICDIWKTAFSDSEIAQRMELGSTKVAYLIVHGLSPFFRAFFINDCKNGTGFFTVYFDETTTRQVKKQMDIHISYWSSHFKKVVNVFMDSSFLGHCDAEKLKDTVIQFLEDCNLSSRYVLQISMDGPAVNLCFQKKINEWLCLQGAEPAVDLGTCSIHPVHTAFTKGVEVLSFDIEQFAQDVFYWFKLSSARREDYQSCQLELDDFMECAGNFFVRPVASRWLSLGSVCRRLIEQYPAMLKYFLTFVVQVSNSKTVCAGERYKRIRASLMDECTIVYLNFIAFLASSLTEFVKLFQSGEPLVHILYDKLNEITRVVMMMFLKPECIEKKEGQKLTEVACDSSENWLSLEKFDIGVKTRLEMSALKNENKKKELCLSFRQCLTKIAHYLQTHLPLKNSILRDLRCLQPRARKDGKSAVGRLCLHLKKIMKDDAYCDRVNNEWLMYMCDNVIDNLQMEYDASNDICHYWQRVSEISDELGGKKYESLSYVAKVSLTLAHSNVIPERGFSINNSMLGKERLSLAEKTIIAERIVKDTIRVYGSVTRVPVTKDLLIACRKAHSEYIHYLEEERRLEQLEKQQRFELAKLAEENKEVQRKKGALLKQLGEKDKLVEEQVHVQETAKELIDEAKNKLASALESKNMQSVQVAYVMLSTGNEKLHESSKKIEELKVLIQKDRIKLAAYDDKKIISVKNSFNSAIVAKPKQQEHLSMNNTASTSKTSIPGDQTVNQTKKRISDNKKPENTKKAKL